MASFIESLFYPSEIAALLSYKFLRRPPTTDIPPSETNKLKCYDFLRKTSRSFAAVIMELNPELMDPICLFYLVLRGLDTIEDDMTIIIDRKEEILRGFSDTIYKRGWTFTESGPNEKDRHLLVEFNVVIEEFLKLDKGYQDVIADITKKMGAGMADYAKNAAHNKFGVDRTKDYDIYCHYVAGLVGIGLSRLFSTSRLEGPEVAEKVELSNSMGLFLQKTNIIRDYLEDMLENRRFWPKEIWSQYAADLKDFKEPANKKAALDCLSTMCLNALHHVPDCLNYLNKLHDPTVFNFCAIPQVMAIATLALVFKNYCVFQKVVKIRKGEAVKLIQQSTDMYTVANIFRHYTRVIISKNESRDPNFLKISIACGQIEQWCHTNLPDIDGPRPSPTAARELNLIDAQLFLLFLFVFVAIAAWLFNLLGIINLDQIVGGFISVK